MKNKINPTKHERVLSENDFIVSKTDTSGRITYCNEIFIEISGYREQELLGAQHNIIRHPDMPRGVFKYLWDTVRAGRECFAYVKNMAKDGSFYWVFTNVTPDVGQDGKTLGYFSVRRRPEPQAVNTISDLYQAMLDKEKQAGPRAAANASLNLLTAVLKEKSVSYEEFILSL